MTNDRASASAGAGRESLGCPPAQSQEPPWLGAGRRQEAGAAATGATAAQPQETSRTPGASELSQLDGRPVLSADDVEGLLRDEWSLAAEVQSFDSERDQNWLVNVAGTPRFVLKIANRHEDPAVIDLQQQLMERLVVVGLPCPRVVPTAACRTTTTFRGHHAWLIGLLPGAILARVPEPSTALLHDLGRVLGRVARALRGFQHHAAYRNMQWDVAQADRVLTTYRPCVNDPARGALLDNALDMFRQHAAPELSQLPHAVIHNDANDHNVLVANGKVSGLIDFGDAVHTVAVNELAVACAYVMLDRADPWAAAAATVAGFESARQLTDPERAVLPHLIRTRLATSVSISAYQQVLAPGDKYLRVSEAPAWRLLYHLTKESP